MLLLLTALLSTARADSIVCDAKSGPKLHYEEWSKSGGAYPGPATPMATWAWTLDGSTLYSRVDTYGGEGSGAQGDLDWSWDLSTRKGGQLPGQPRSLEEAVHYTADVTVWTRSGRPLGGGSAGAGLAEPRLTVNMSCTMTRQYGVP